MTISDFIKMDDLGDLMRLRNCMALVVMLVLAAGRIKQTEPEIMRRLRSG